MNDFQSPYLDGQVLNSPDLDDARPRTETSPPLPVSQFDKKIDGCSKSASDCLHKTQRLAREFNHGTMCAAHLVLAMTLVPNASRQFELRKVDINKAFRAAMSALMDMERGSAGNGAAPSLSDEFSIVVTLAQELAKNRDNQEVSVDDLLTALDRLPLDSAAAQLIRGERPNGQSHELRDALEQLSGNVERQLQELTRAIQLSSDSSAIARDIGELKDTLRARDFNLVDSIRTQFAEIRDRLPSAAVPDPVPGNGAAPPTSQPARPGGIWDMLKS